ncbi:DUF1702 family protein [Nonomuraea sp. NPDC050556]|uniref:DUF1702 family protein n=1 Tax=Nonomuraea sp. NPDC050556 TaxID=3364369 RepID=UPI0037BD7ED0
MQGHKEADLGRRRFRLRQGPSREVLENAEKTYVLGFNAAVSREIEKIAEIAVEQRGFAYEGAATASTILDLATMTRGRRLHELLAGPAMAYQHSVHLGVGRAYARLHLRPTWGIRRTHPLMRWLAVDGFGFQRALTHADQLVGERSMPNLLTRTQCAIFDQGLGRLLWFHDCASPEEVAARIAEFPTGRRADLWAGVGFAATYVGGADLEELARLTTLASAEGFRSHLAQGCAFAAAARLQAGTLPDHTAQAVPLLAGAEPQEAAAWADTALIALGHDPHTHEDFQAWRAHTRRAWSRRNR